MTLRTVFAAIALPVINYSLDMKHLFTLLSLSILLSLGNSAKAQNALNFPDANDYGAVPQNLAFEFWEGFALEAWIKVNGSGYQTVVATDSLNANGHLGYWFGVTPSGLTGFQIFDGDFSWNTFTGTTNVNDNQWHHIAVSTDMTNVNIVVDGVQESSGAYYAPAWSGIGHRLDVGVDQEGNYISGTIDDLRLWWKHVPTADINLYKDSCLTGMEDSLLALYKFDETMGSTFADAAPLALNGQLYNMTDSDWVSGIVCQTPPPPFNYTVSALDFDGVDDYVEIDSTLEDAFDFTLPVTIEAWIKPETPTNGSQLGTIIGNVDASVTNGTFFGLAGNAIAFETDGGGNVTSTVGTVNLVDGSCHHVALVIEADSTRMYVDGNPDGAVVATVAPGANDQQMWIGNNASGTHHYKGSISQIRFWNTARSANEINTWMDSSFVGSTNSDLIAFYEFDGYSGLSTLNDQLANGNLDGDLINMDVNNAWIVDSCVQTNQNTAFLSEPSILEGVTIYPNPTQGSVQIDVASADVFDVYVYGVDGQLVHSYVGAQWAHNFELNSNSGVYQIVLISQNGATKHFKLVKL